MPRADFVIKAGSAYSVFRATLVDPDGDAVDLSDASDVELVLRLRGSIAAGTAYDLDILSPATAGRVEYVPAGTEWDAGRYDALVQGTKAGLPFKFPSSGFLFVLVTDNLG